MMRIFIILLSILSMRLAVANEFFAMDNGLRDVKNLNNKATLLNELGYNGVTWRPGNTVEAVRAMKSKDIKVTALMMKLPVAKERKLPELPLADFETLKGTGAILWVQLTRHGGDDADAVHALQQLNSIAEPHGLRIAIYPHVNNHVESLEDSLRIAQLVAKDNVGVSLTLCHQLKTRGMQDLEPLLKQALPKLFIVQISGAESGETKSMGWEKLIQPLGQGSYELKRLIKILRDLHYQGPVGVIGYGLKQTAKQHLQQSINFWRAQTTKKED